MQSVRLSGCNRKACSNRHSCDFSGYRTISRILRCGFNFIACSLDTKIMLDVSLKFMASSSEELKAMTKFLFLQFLLLLLTGSLLIY